MPLGLLWPRRTSRLTIEEELDQTETTAEVTGPEEEGEASPEEAEEEKEEA